LNYGTRRNLLKNKKYIIFGMIIALVFVNQHDSRNHTTSKRQQAMNAFMRLFFILSLIYSGAASAIAFTSIDPAIFGPDIDGDGYFAQDSSLSISIEVYDVFDSDLDFGLEFGLFFEGASSNLFAVFDSSEGSNSYAALDFANGMVIDLEDLGVETVFMPSSADFGFYLSVFGPGGLINTLYSDPILNGGYDFFGAFPLLDPNYTDAFAANFYTDGGDLLYLAPMIPTVTAVPLPSALLLFSSGLVLLNGFNRRRLTAKS
jgi:hypothetical protein